MIGKDGGIKDMVCTTKVSIEVINENTCDIHTTSAETCSINYLNSNREEIHARLSTETLINQCGNIWGREIQRQVTFVCDNTSAIGELEQNEGWKK
mmetsp:Transcript_10443/g.10033  ORF Transcript_10443/g.10033 Transcript_10443/m.10033 type:complete len:96 (-) Transcript_10443:1-288(-)